MQGGCLEVGIQFSIENAVHDLQEVGTKSLKSEKVHLERNREINQPGSKSHSCTSNLRKRQRCFSDRRDNLFTKINPITHFFSIPVVELETVHYLTPEIGRIFTRLHEAVSPKDSSQHARKHKQRPLSSSRDLKRPTLP